MGTQVRGRNVKTTPHDSEGIVQRSQYLVLCDLRSMRYAIMQVS